MLVFKEINDYSGFLGIIKDALSKSETYEAKRNFPNARGLLYLANLNDKAVQKEAIEVLRKIDRELDNQSKNGDNLINNKLSFFLEAGIAFGEHYDLLTSLNTNSKVEVILSAPILWYDNEDATRYLPIFCDEQFVSMLQKDHPRDIPEIMLAMKEHYDNLSLANPDSNTILNFRNNEIFKLNTDKESFLNDVPSYSDIAFEVEEKLRRGRI